MFDFPEFLFIMSIPMSNSIIFFFTFFLEFLNVSKPMPSSELKSLGKQKFTNLTQYHWYIKPLGSYELCVRGPATTDKSRRQIKSYGDVRNVRVTKITKSNPTPIIQVLVSKGWLHLDPIKYENCSSSDISIGLLMSKTLTKTNNINRKMSNILLVILSY